MSSSARGLALERLAAPLLLVALVACARGEDAPAGTAGVAPPTAAAPPEGEPRISFSSPRSLEIADANLVHDFGQVRQGESVAHVFLFVWNGAQPLVPGELSADCACIRGILLSGADGQGPVPHPGGQPIPPGAPFAVKVGLDAPAVHGPVRKRVTVICDDPPGALRLIVTAEIVP